LFDKHIINQLYVGVLHDINKQGGYI